METLVIYKKRSQIVERMYLLGGKHVPHTVNSIINQNSFYYGTNFNASCGYKQQPI